MGLLSAGRPLLTSKAATLPAIFWSKAEARKMEKQIKAWPKRLPRGRELFVLHMANELKTLVQSTAPEVDGYDYAKELEVVLLSGDPDWETVAAVIHPGKERTLNRGEKDTLLYVQPAKNASGYVWTLRKYGPWPSSLMPGSVSGRQGRVITRRATPREIRQVERNIRRNRSQIEQALRRGGLTDVDLTQRREKQSGRQVLSDLGHEVLRVEFGINTRQLSHWRPAVKQVVASVEKVAKKYVEYLETGKEGVFTADASGTIRPSEYEPARKFSDVITKASGYR